MLLNQDSVTTAHRTFKTDRLFVVDDPRGFIPYGNPAGFGFYDLDTRFLSCLEIELAGTHPVPLLSSTESGAMSSLFYTNATLEARTEDDGTSYTIPEMTLQLRRESVLAEALFERMTLMNFNAFPVRLPLQFRVDADFVDIFQVRHLSELPERRGRLPVVRTPQGLTFPYVDGTGQRLETRILFHDFTPEIREHPDGGMVFTETVALAPLEKRELHFEVRAVSMATTGNSGPRQTLDGGAGSYEASFRRVSGWNQGWLEQATVFETDNPDLNEMLERARRDIAMLLTASPCSDDGSSQTYVAAGIPWYVALFGRDSLIAARDCLLLQPSLAVGILRLLARYQGKQDDPWRDEAPGKILHELRVGELARMNDIPHTPYYGTVDATPLWLMLLHDTYCWTHDRALLEELWLNALAALGWIDRGLASSPNGFLCYEAHPGKGLTHQGWKDSGDSAMYEDGRPAHAPLALAEVQGYVYQAKVRLAALAELRDETSLAIRLRDEAREFKRRFNQAFWQEDLGFCALALDGQGAPLRVVASNPGHCLEADLLTPPLAERVAARLMEPDMFNGWGIRTLSSQAVAYNPMSYHNGSVWPHDNALIARGFAAMGRGEFALKIFGGLFDAGRLMFYKRLPELFCGFARDFEHDVNPPVRYPVACSPQAWAASSVFALLQSLLNLRPVLDSQALRIREPQLPTGVNRLKLRRLRVGASLLDLEFKRTDKTVTVEIRERQGPVSIVL